MTQTVLTRTAARILCLSLCLFSVACTNANLPTFTVQPLQVTSMQMLSNSADPTVPKKIQFTLQACLNNSTLTSKTTTTKTEFEFSGDGVPTQTLVTDDKGCVYWPETVSYNYLDQETYIKFSRTLTGKGDLGGTQVLPFAMNPWKTSKDGFIDLRFNSIDDSLISEDASSHSNTKQFFVHTVSVHTYDAVTDPSGTSIHAQFSMSPFLTRLGIGQNEVREAINKGHFNIDLYLLELNRDNDPAKTILLSKTSLPVDSEDGVLNVNALLHLSQIPKQNSQLAFAFKLTYLASTKEISQESMLFIDQLLTQSTISIQNLTQPISSFAGTAPSTAAQAGDVHKTTSPDADKAAGFRIDSVKMDSGGVVATQRSTSASKAISSKIVVCLKDSLSLKNIVDHSFQVGVADSADSKDIHFSTVVSDSGGCLFWETQIDFDSYASEHWYEKHLIIRSDNAPYLNVQNSFLIYVNPWQLGWLYAWDSRNGPPPTSPPASENNPATQNDLLSVREIAYSFIGRDFELDRKLNLTMNRHYQIRFQPFIARARAYNSDINYISFDNGRLNFRILIKSGGIPISMYSGSAPVINGEIVTEITLPFDILAFPRVLDRDEMYFELTDSDPKSTLRTQTLVTPFVPITPSANSGLETAKLDPLKADSQKSIHDTITEPPIDSNRLTENDLAKLGFANSSEIKSFIERSGGDSADSSRFCELLYSQTEEIEACQNNPKQYVLVEQKVPSPALLGATTELSTDIFMLNASSGEGFRTDQSKRESLAESNAKTFSTSARATMSTKASASVKASVGTPFPIFKLGGDAGIGVDAGVGRDTGVSHQWNWYTAHSADQGQSHSHDFSVSKAHSLVVEQITVRAFTDPGKCVSVSNNHADQPATFFFCTDPHTGPMLTNNWYFVHPQFSSGTMIDGNKIEPMSFTTVIRGDKGFQEFRKTYEDKTRTLVFVKNFAPQEAMRDFLARNTGHLGDVLTGKRTFLKDLTDFKSSLIDKQNLVNDIFDPASGRPQASQPKH